MSFREITKISVHLDRDIKTQRVNEDPAVRAKECGHPGTEGHAFWLDVKAGETEVSFCFGEDKMALDRFASAISEAVTAFVG